MAILKIFKAAVLNCSYLFKDGTQAAFLSGKYQTSDPKQIEELTAEIVNVGISNSKHPMLYIDESEQEIDSNAPTPMELIRAQAMKDAIAQLVASGQYTPSKDSTSTQNPFASSVANTLTIAEGAAGSDSSGANLAPTSVTGASLMSASASAALASLSAKG